MRKAGSRGQRQKGGRRRSARLGREGTHIALALLGLVKTVLVAIRKWGVLDVANDLARRSQRDSTQREAVRIFRVE